MSKISRFPRWLINNFVFFTIAVFATVYLWWFRVSPKANMFITGASLLIAYAVFSILLKKFDQTSIAAKLLVPAISSFLLVVTPIPGFLLGLLLLTSYLVFSIFRFVQKQVDLKNFYIFVAIILFASNFYHILAYKPNVLDTMQFDGTSYYLTWNVDALVENSHLQFTKWRGTDYEATNLVYMKYLPYAAKFFIDKTSNEVSIIKTSSNDELAYTDSIPPREYEPHPVRLGNHRYYVSAQRLETTICKDGFECTIYRYTMYKCELDNTACSSLPFQYIAEYDYSILEVEETNREVNFYLDPHPFDHPILIYTFGDHPQCYVEGCEILEEIK